MTLPRGRRWGILIATVGGALMVLGGVGDLMIRELFPNHLRLLGYEASLAPEGAETLIHAEGANVLGMVRTGSPLFFAPLSFLLLVLLGVGLYLGTPRSEVEPL